MIQNPIALVFVLLSIEIFVLYLAGHRRWARFFNALPAVFWMYFLPMLASSFGWIDSQSPVYSKITTYLLPMALFLLLMTVDMKAILRLGPAALMMFVIGSVGIVLGIVVVFVLLKGTVGADFWSGFAALSGSWTGGSANMIAVKEALGTPDAVFLPMVIVDTIVPYVWMALMVACVGLAPVFDRWNQADKTILEDLNQRMKGVAPVQAPRLTVLRAMGLMVLAGAGAGVSIYLGQLLPEIKGIISTYAWTILLVSCLGIFASLTPLRKLESYGTNKVGYFILYFVLMTIGSKASMHHLPTAMILVAGGFGVVFIHATILLIAAKLFRVPLFLAATASQANIGGVASAPLVAEIYQKGFASVGLLLAILGNIAGTYIGLVVGHILHVMM